MLWVFCSLLSYLAWTESDMNATYSSGPGSLSVCIHVMTYISTRMDLNMYLHTIGQTISDFRYNSMFRRTSRKQYCLSINAEYEASKEYSPCIDTSLQHSRHRGMRQHECISLRACCFEQQISCGQHRSTWSSKLGCFKIRLNVQEDSCNSGWCSIAVVLPKRFM